MGEKSPTGPLCRPQVGESVKLVKDGTADKEVVHVGVPAEPRGRTA
ncbi:hypothetical protein [Kitasatospora sp. NPDC098663]